MPEIDEHDDDKDDDGPAMTKSDELELKKLRQQVDEVLHKVSVTHSFVSSRLDHTGLRCHSLPVSTSVSPKASIAMIRIQERSMPTEANGACTNASSVNAT